MTVPTARARTLMRLLTESLDSYDDGKPVHDKVLVDLMALGTATLQMYAEVAADELRSKVAAQTNKVTP